MDNIIHPYKVQTESDEDSDDSDSSHEGNLLTNNLGIYNNKFEIKDQRFMNMQKIEDYEIKLKELFTPKLQKKYMTIKFIQNNTNPIIIDLKKTNLPLKNIIGFKMIKSNFQGDGTSLYTDLIIDELPEISCDTAYDFSLDQNSSLESNSKKIFSRIPLRPDYYTHQFLELSLIDRYFYPKSFDELTINLNPILNGFVVIEITYLNE